MAVLICKGSWKVSYIRQIVLCHLKTMVSINLRKGAWMFSFCQITSVCFSFLFWKMMVMMVLYRFVGGGSVR